MADDQIAVEKEKTRRRLITFGEVVAVLAVLISALSLWDSHNKRVAEERQQSAGETRAEQQARHLLLRAKPDSDGARLTLSAQRDDQVIQDQTIRFPTALGIAPVQTSGDPRIEARWLAGPVKDAEKLAGTGDQLGDRRMPVAITTQYIANGTPYTDHAIYDVGYGKRGRFLLGDEIRLRGLTLVSRGKSASLSAQLDTRWRAVQPRPRKPTP